MKKETNVDDILREKDLPAVAIDAQGIFFFVNEAFEKAYGWKKEDLIGNVITKIMPPYMRDAHNFGFSRFLTTETPRILGQKFALPVYCKNSDIVDAEHYIVGEKKDTVWRFAAIIQVRKDT
ncbi:MAG: PAS domain S-box protein [bacterium]|nr:PAS domain S-box protein [bacterium]